jgi:hypothetical protein
MPGDARAIGDRVGGRGREFVWIAVGTAQEDPPRFVKSTITRLRLDAVLIGSLTLDDRFRGARAPGLHLSDLGSTPSKARVIPARRTPIGDGGEDRAPKVLDDDMGATFDR